jgi:Fe2+ or Zn2+ uptake regulation protein
MSVPTPDLATRLRDRGQRVTSQRVVLHEVLRTLDRHVSADEVLRAAAPRLPGLSRPTVYATLELFEGLGLVRRVVTPTMGGAVLYDPRTDEHDHLVCRRCGRVADLEGAVDATAALDAAARAGARPERADVVVSGLCRECAGA